MQILFATAQTLGYLPNHCTHESTAMTYAVPNELLTQESSVNEQGIKLLGLLLTGSTGQHMASRNGLA